MTPEEKEASTDHLMEEVSDLRDTKAIATRNLPSAIFNDAHATLAAMETEVNVQLFHTMMTS